MQRGCRNKLLLLGLLLLWTTPFLAAQTSYKDDAEPLPDAPLPQTQRVAEPDAMPAGQWVAGQFGMQELCPAHACGAQPGQPVMCCGQPESRFHTYLQARAYHIYTPRELATMAAKDVADPFNLLSLVGSAAIVVSSDSHSIYGPGWPGLARASGVALTEDMTDEFFGTFVIPSIDHQEPGFRRMPNRPFLRRLVHCATQVFWTRSQTGQPMVNYSNVVGNMAEEAVATTYVPFRQQGWGQAAVRLGLNYATDPIGNLISEFVPQVASHINVRVVFFQNIINRVATTVGQPPSM